MRTKFEVGAIAGKFRLLHFGHVESIIHATSLCAEVHVIIVDNPSIKRYSTIEELKNSFIEVFEKLEFFNFFLHVVSPLDGEEWDEKVKELVPNIDVIFNSKENYPNFLIDNYYIETIINDTVSVSDIEQNFYRNYSLIAPEFRQYVNGKIIISGMRNIGKSQLSKKISVFFDTVYSKDKIINYSTENIGVFEEIVPMDIQRLIAEKIEKDDSLNEIANKFLVFDTDPISLYQHLIENRSRIVEQNTASIYEELVIIVEDYIEEFYNENDFVLFMKWDNHEEKEELENLYEKFSVNVRVLWIRDYDDAFSKAIHLINEYFEYFPRIYNKRGAENVER